MLNEKEINLILTHTNPCAQNTNNNDLGFGLIYYSITRNLKPTKVLVIGSKKGFSPICFAIGLRDNNKGYLYFVDAGYDYSDEKNMGGIGFWKNKAECNKLFNMFNVQNIILPYIETTKSFNDKIGIDAKFDLIFIDGDHSYEGFKYDFEEIALKHIDDGIILFHDVLVDKDHCGFNFGIKRYFEEKIRANENLESFRLPVWPGLGFCRKINIQS